MELTTVERFVTTNYDAELERALVEAGRCERAAFGIRDPWFGEATAVPPRSFTHDPRHVDRLAVFALARCAGLNQNMVFHAHGRFDDIRSIIATEAEYQEAYLSSDRGGRFEFTQTVDLLLRANTILFIGYSLSDEDLLRPLRTLAAARRGVGGRATAFVIVEEASKAAGWAEHRLLHERYGVHALPYVCDPQAGNEARAAALASAIGEVKERWRAWATGWRALPALKRVVVPVATPTHGSEPYLHHAFAATPAGAIFDEAWLVREVEELSTGLDAGARVVGIVGDGGTGKSWLALRLIEVLRASRSRFEGYFFWSSYYARDRLTGLERLHRYVHGDDEDIPLDLEKLKQTLRRRPILVVMDGYERLLEETRESGVGRATDPGVEEFLRTFTAPGECASSLVLTTRLWPEFVVADGSTFIQHRMRRPSSGDLAADVASVGVVPEEARARRAALCSLLDGHAYGLALAVQYLRSEPHGVDLYPRLVETLAAVAPDRRVSAMIRHVIESTEARSGAGTRSVLEGMAVFLGPVSRTVAESCLAPEAVTPDPERAGAAVGDVIDRLTEACLIFRLRRTKGDDDERFVLHPTVRSFVHGRHHVGPGRDWPNFSLAGYTSGGASVDPGGIEGVKTVKRVFRAVAGAADAALGRRDLHAARDRVSALFAVMRSEMEANTATRWATVSAYLEFGMRVANLAKLVATSTWSFADRMQRGVGGPDSGALYGDELAWLYNDLGLALCAQGDMPDAYAVWEAGYEINKLIEPGERVRQRVLQSQLHFAHVFLDMGDLRAASDWLEKCRRTNFDVRSPDYSHRIAGYEGLVAHLRGDVPRATERYAEALRPDRDRAPRNARSVAVFSFHCAALLMSERRFAAARRRIDEGEVAAKSGRHPDLEARAWLTRGTWFRRRKDARRATMAFERALARSRELEIGRLEVDVLAERAALALTLGDHTTARSRAMDALALANDLGLGLRQTSALVLLGQSTVVAGDRALGGAYLEAAVRLGARQEYFFKVREAQTALDRVRGQLPTRLGPQASAGPGGADEALRSPGPGSS